MTNKCALSAIATQRNRDAALTGTPSAESVIAKSP
jgi:hypothetical protein